MATFTHLAVDRLSTGAAGFSSMWPLILQFRLILCASVRVLRKRNLGYTIFNFSLLASHLLIPQVT
jgi:hypothetical protein